MNIELSPDPFPHEKIRSGHETSVNVYYMEWCVHFCSLPQNTVYEVHHHGDIHRKIVTDLGKHGLVLGVVC